MLLLLLLAIKKATVRGSALKPEQPDSRTGMAVNKPSPSPFAGKIVLSGIHTRRETFEYEEQLSMYTEKERLY